MSATIIGHIPVDVMGNSTGGSIQSTPQLRSWYRADWIKVLRPLEKGQVIADCFLSIVKSIKKDIQQEENLWELLNHSSWDLNAIPDWSACDNLTLLSCVLKMAGYSLSQPLTLDSMAILEQRGFQRLTSGKFTSSSMWLCPGDIIISPKHAALVIENRSIVAESELTAPVSDIGEIIINEETDVQLAGVGVKYGRVFIDQRFMVSKITPTGYQFYLNWDAGIKAFIEKNKCTFYPTVKQKITNYKIQSVAPTIIFYDEDGIHPIKRITAQIPQVYTVIMEKGDLAKIKGCQGWINLKNFVKIS